MDVSELKTSDLVKEREGEGGKREDKRERHQRITVANTV